MCIYIVICIHMHIYVNIHMHFLELALFYFCQSTKNELYKRSKKLDLFNSITLGFNPKRNISINTFFCKIANVSLPKQVFMSALRVCVSTLNILFIYIRGKILCTLFDTLLFFLDYMPWRLFPQKLYLIL